MSTNKSSKKYFLTIGIGLFSLFTFFLIIGSTDKPFILELKQANSPFTKFPYELSEQIVDSNLVIKDSSEIKPLQEHDSTISDTNRNNGERVMLIGDSQLEGLRNPVYECCAKNHHKLVASVLWYGSSTKQWGNSDTLNYFLKKYKPTYLFIALGLNELFVRDLDNRRLYINNIISTIKKHHIRYFWIGPAAWTKDKGITSLLQEINGTLFYPSHKLTLERADDNRHPSRKAAKIWFDSVAISVSKLKTSGIDLSLNRDTIIKITNSPLIIIGQEK